MNPYIDKEDKRTKNRAHSPVLLDLILLFKVKRFWLYLRSTTTIELKPYRKIENTECPFLTLQPPTPPDSRFTLSKMKYTYPFQKTDHSGQIQLIKQLLIVSNTETGR